jgi:sporulation protein YlmC with PRC-barrel domain
LSIIFTKEINLKVSKLNGMKVITSNAFTLGEVEGARANIDTWQITNLDVSLTKETIKELGFKKPLPILGSMTVCLPIAAVKTVGDVIALKHTLEEFKNLKECRVE